MSDLDVRAALRVLERAGWRGLEESQVMAAADALMRERARIWLRHPGCKVRFSLAYSFGPDGEPLVDVDSVEVSNETQRQPDGQRGCPFVGLDGLRCDLLDGHSGDCVLA